MTCKVSVVFPEASGPYISVIRPRGIPPTPSTWSRVKAPVEMTSTFTLLLAPSFINEPCPNFLLIKSLIESIASALPLFLGTASLVSFFLTAIHILLYTVFYAVYIISIFIIKIATHKIYNLCISPFSTLFNTLPIIALLFII